ncbi:hypothetical protein BJX64DRAFT_126615 [Aspergillus heterothallicus]
MSTTIIDIFSRYVLPGRELPLHHQPASNASRVPALEPGGKLFDLFHRVYTLHYDSKREHLLKAITISQAVQIWHELDTWDSDEKEEEEGRSSEIQTSYQLYKHALFLWTYLIVNPDDISGWKVQNAVRTILAGAGEVVAEVELGLLAIIPLFFCGVAAVLSEDREAVEGNFEHLMAIIGEDRVKYPYNTVQRSWSSLDGGFRSSWDWMKHN